MQPARLPRRLLLLLPSFLGRPPPTVAPRGLRGQLHGTRRCTTSASSENSACLGRGFPRGSRAAGNSEGRHDAEESFLFPEYVRDPEPGAALEKEVRELRELQQLHEEEERRKQQLREAKWLQKLRPRRREEQMRRHSDPDPSSLHSGLSCSGCGAELHCQDPGLPGYLPSEKFSSAGAGTVCQRCWLLVHHRRALRLQVSPEQFLQLVSSALRRPGPALVLYMVDLLDLPDALMPQLPALVGPKQLIVLGNKVDLLPQDSPNYRQRIRDRLREECARAGLLPPPGSRGPPHPSGDGPGNLEEDPSPKAKAKPGPVLRDVRLISAKTGYGVEELISALQRSWRYRGDVYLVGATNAGKSTLFNTLLESDYCIAKGAEAIDRATISPWPGEPPRLTTLRLLRSSTTK